MWEILGSRRWSPHDLWQLIKKQCRLLQNALCICAPVYFCIRVFLYLCICWLKGHVASCKTLCLWSNISAKFQMFFNALSLEKNFHWRKNLSTGNLPTPRSSCDCFRCKFPWAVFFIRKLRKCKIGEIGVSWVQRAINYCVGAPTWGTGTHHRGGKVMVFIEILSCLKTLCLFILF